MSARRIPYPGQRVRGSTTGRPVMALFDLLGRRWALRVIWELRDGRRLNFRDLLAASGTSPGVLNTRLAELRDTGLVDHEPDAGYGLTPMGAELLARLLPVADWAKHWHNFLKNGTKS
ncbi:MAG: winged helix-turn-helix transcriptional regulator [Rhodopila sp.]